MMRKHQYRTKRPQSLYALYHMYINLLFQQIGTQTRGTLHRLLMLPLIYAGLMA